MPHRDRGHTETQDTQSSDVVPVSCGSRPVSIGRPGWGQLFCSGAHTTRGKKTNPSFRHGINETVFTISTNLIEQ